MSKTQKSMKNDGHSCWPRNLRRNTLCAAAMKLLCTIRTREKLEQWEKAVKGLARKAPPVKVELSWYWREKRGIEITLVIGYTSDKQSEVRSFDVLISVASFLALCRWCRCSISGRCEEGQVHERASPLPLPSWLL